MAIPRYQRSEHRVSRMRGTSGGTRWILWLILAAVVCAAIVIVSSSTGTKDKVFDRQRDIRLRSEAQRAVSSVNSLSSLGASSSSGTLGKIRQYIHGMELIDEISVGIHGESGRIYPQSMFDEAFSIIDEYDTRLSTGQKITETLDTLRGSVEALSQYTDQRLTELSK